MNTSQAKERVVIFPGSFDPFTLGHFDLVKRALNLFDRVIVAVLLNPKKNTLFSAEERVSLVSSVCKEFGDRLQVKSFTGLLADFATKEGTGFVMRGLRAISDYEYESQMALMNRHISGNIETVFLMSKEEASFISSSLVREVALLGGDVSKFVPKEIGAALLNKIAEIKNSSKK